ncbi:unnamed protein product [Rhodiola kirilowii]
MSRNVSAVIQRKVPPKCGDPGTYTIPCTIEPAGLTIQLADRSCKQPEGKIEDVLVQVGELVFPADFYVLKMEHSSPTGPCTDSTR